MSPPGLDPLREGRDGAAPEVVVGTVPPILPWTPTPCGLPETRTVSPVASPVMADFLRSRPHTDTEEWPECQNYQYCLSLKLISKEISVQWPGGPSLNFKWCQKLPLLCQNQDSAIVQKLSCTWLMAQLVVFGWLIAGSCTWPSAPSIWIGCALAVKSTVIPHQMPWRPLVTSSGIHRHVC